MEGAITDYRRLPGLFLPAGLSLTKLGALAQCVQGSLVSGALVCRRARIVVFDSGLLHRRGHRGVRQSGRETGAGESLSVFRAGHQRVGDHLDGADFGDGVGYWRGVVQRDKVR